MKLKTASGNAFELVIVGYENPDITEGVWESNWLVVSGEVRTSDESWRFVDSCVTTFELADLAAWLEGLDSGALESPTRTFAEPNLEFSYSPTPDPVLRVRFAHESAPPRLKDTDAKAEGVVMEIRLEELDAQAAAAELRDALIDFPIRGGAA
jgi:hypothetical protein